MDRAKVANGLEECMELLDCAGTREQCKKYIADVIILLKEQEPITPVNDGYGSYICGNQGYDCGCVGAYNPWTKTIDRYCNFCPSCGRKVKWE